ncbi:MAG: cation diffusion facilitator family transporter [Candidatus Peribacteraceae bacterium]|jgi:cation diffusion facilitator family transporter
MNRGIRSVQIGLVINALMAAVKFAAGFFGHSYALIADGIESTTDIASSLVIWGGLRISAVPPDKEHPYGHGRAEAIAASVVALTLLAAAAVNAYAAVREILTPHSTPAPFTLVVLALVVITKETLFKNVYKVGSETGSHAVKTDAWHHRSDAITSAAAFVGITISLIGGPGWEGADDWAALAVTVVIAINAFQLLRPSVHELMDKVHAGPESEALIAAALAVEGVRAVEKIRVRKLGTQYHVDAHVHADGSLSLRDAHIISGKVKSAFRVFLPNMVDASVHMEPYGE